MAIKLVFFDLDRTLIDYLSLNELCFLFEREGLVEGPDSNWMEVLQQQRQANLISYGEIVATIGRRLAWYTRGYLPKELYMYYWYGRFSWRLAYAGSGRQGSTV